MEFIFEGGERDRRNHVRRACWSAAGYCGLLLSATHWPKLVVPMSHGHLAWDKVVHFGAYAILAAMLMWVWRSRRSGQAGARAGWPALRAGALIFLAASLLGIFDETTQPLTGRDFDWFDWVADIVGAWCGISISLLAAIGSANALRCETTPEPPCSSIAETP